MRAHQLASVALLPSQTSELPYSVALDHASERLQSRAPLTPRLLLIKDAAAYLSAATHEIENLLEEKAIPSFLLGDKRVVDRLELDQYIERRNAEAKTANIETSK